MPSGLSGGGRKVPLDLVLPVLMVVLIVSRLWHLSWPWKALIHGVAMTAQMELDTNGFWPMPCGHVFAWRMQARSRVAPALGVV